jgi:DNA helicase-2/ATP-dependent DNA helicase PcrA
MFYVALSRAKNLLVVAHPQGRGVKTHFAFKSILDKSMTTIPKFDFDTLPAAKVEVKDVSKSYSYTSDYLAYQKCARQYMLFRKYGFSPSRSQTMFFGSLVHLTLEDLHNRLIANKGAL